MPVECYVTLWIISFTSRNCFLSKILFSRSKVGRSDHYLYPSLEMWISNLNTWLMAYWHIYMYMCNKPLVSECVNTHSNTSTFYFQVWQIPNNILSFKFVSTDLCESGEFDCILPLTNSYGKDHMFLHCWFSACHQNLQSHRLCHLTQPFCASTVQHWDIQFVSIYWWRNYISRHHVEFLSHLQQAWCILVL